MAYHLRQGEGQAAPLLETRCTYLEGPQQMVKDNFILSSKFMMATIVIF
jgi:hypothetical protein